MSEYVNRISPSFKQIYNDIDWINIKGFRNRLVHNYGEVDLKFLYVAISKDVIELKQKLTDILNY